MGMARRDGLGVRHLVRRVVLAVVSATVVFISIAFLSISVGSGGPASGRFPADEIIADRRRALVPWRAGERNVVIAFGVTVSLWIGPDLLPLFLRRDHLLAVQPSGPEAVAALTGRSLLFALPISPTERSTPHLAGGRRRSTGGTILLFGGGAFPRGAVCAVPGLARVVGEGTTGLVLPNGVAPVTFACSPTPCRTPRPPIPLPAGVDPITSASATARGAIRR